MNETTLDISRLRPLGTKVLVKRKPVDERVKSILIPEDLRDRNTTKGDLFCGIVIAVGRRTNSAKYGHERGWYEPGDVVWWYGLYDWADKQIVIKDDSTSDEYLIIDESDIKAIDSLQSEESKCR